mmetsp:Transcript_20950/g.53049  ORF Transcript_20950/g.53049 Transcript_20950/m.53049 type:complete len:163 (-) Transcript_20950:281-769(-)
MLLDTPLPLQIFITNLVVCFVGELLLSALGKDSLEEKKLKAELLDLARKSNTLNTPSTFSKFALCQRQMNQKKEKLQDLQSKKSNLSIPYLGLTFLSRLFLPILQLYFFSGKVMFSLSADLGVWWPVSSLLAFPGWKEGEVGILAWTLICSRVSGLFVSVLL